MHRKLLLYLFSIIVLTTGCSVFPVTPAHHAAIGMDDVTACVEALGQSIEPATNELNADQISIVNWNIHKGRDSDWIRDLGQASVDPDLIILQEAAPHRIEQQGFGPDLFQSYTEGFGLGKKTSGVATYSVSSPLTECNLVTFEPWFGTRKSMLVTEYGLTGTHSSLLVVNVHGINLTFGVRDLQRQLHKAQAIIAAHKGPVLFSGDFNTWHRKRVRTLDKVVRELGLFPVRFEPDFRSRFFGHPLDHIYARGLDTIGTSTQDLNSSDHNPMFVVFRLSKSHLHAH